MAKYRKKPVVVDAVRWTGDSGILFEFGAYNKTAFRMTRDHDGSGDLMVRTLEGWLRAKKGDWIVRGVSGEFYPVKPDIFEQTYEPAE